MLKCIAKWINLLLILCVASCSPVPDGVTKVVDMSGDNRVELEKVITYYKQQRDKEKLKAAFYLISNMEDKFFWDGEVVTDFDSIFRYIDSLHREKAHVSALTPLIEERWRSLLNLYGSPSTSLAEYGMIMNI